jgi:2'-5' RNA ligase
VVLGRKIALRSICAPRRARRQDNARMETSVAIAGPRVFLALWPEAPVRDALVARAQAWDWPDQVRRTRPERLHVTLHFLGNVDAGLLPRMQQALGVPWPGCELELDTPRIWPGGIAVLEAGTVPAELAALHTALGERLQALGIAVEERRYRPHVTLARKAFGAHPPAGFEPLRWRAGPQYRLVQTLVGGRGYEPLQFFG